MTARYIDLFVKAPPGNGYTTPNAMKRVDEHLIQQFPAMFLAPEGVPIQEADGSFQVRILDTSELAVLMVKNLLTKHYGLEIIREVPDAGDDEDASSEESDSKQE